MILITHCRSVLGAEPNSASAALYSALRTAFSTASASTVSATS
jgi:hypothetical protein